MTSSINPLYRERLLHERAQLLLRIAQERGGVVSRADMAADHFDNSFQSRAQIQTERQTEFAMNEHETAELGDIEAALADMNGTRDARCLEACDAASAAKQAVPGFDCGCVAAAEPLGTTH